MSTLWSRIQNLGNLAFMLRMMADTIRLFSDTKQRGGNYISPATRVSLKVDEAADDLDDIVQTEAKNAKKRGGDAA